MRAEPRSRQCRPLQGLVAIAIAWVLLGCCCPALPPALVRTDEARRALAAPPVDPAAAPLALRVGPAVQR